MTVFSTKNLEDILRPIAFFIILDFVWTKIKKDLKKRILIVEEAWNLLQREDSARFIYGIAKRARKYYLGLTTISQDVDEFLKSEYGKAIVTNSSIQVLLKQHPAAIDIVADTFYLSEGEKRLLLSADKGEGLFFAGSNHVAIKSVASEAEHKLITTNPEELLKLRAESLRGSQRESNKPVYKPFNPVEADKYKTMDETGAAKPEFQPKPVLQSDPTNPIPNTPYQPARQTQPITPSTLTEPRPETQSSPLPVARPDWQKPQQSPQTQQPQKTQQPQQQQTAPLYQSTQVSQQNTTYQPKQKEGIITLGNTYPKQGDITTLTPTSPPTPNTN